MPSLSSSMDRILEMCTPISRWIPEHSIHSKTPRFVANHVGSVERLQPTIYFFFKLVRLDSGSSGPGSNPGPRFVKNQETFRARKAIFSPSVSENGEVYTSKTYCIKGTSVHIKSM